ncbi:MAG: M61 family metallopeptidase [Nitriliruptoraceae bacterium]
MTVPIRYDVDLTERDHHLVVVTLTVPADVAGGARLVLPVWTPGSYVVRDYARHVQTLAATDASGAEVAVTREGTAAWRLPEDTRGPVTVVYELYADDLSVRTNHVDDHHALLIPAATFILVDGAEDRPHEVHLPPVPSHHTVHSLLPAGSAADTFVAADRDHLIDSAFEVGDLPHIDVEVAGVPHRFVWSGHGGAPPLPHIARDLHAVAGSCLDLLGQPLPTDRYTILCAGWDQGGGGLEHRDGAVLQVPVHTFQDAAMTARFQSLLAHEYLHLWNVKRLVPTDLVRPVYDRPTHSPSLWVAEGWTAYYDELLPTRAGLWQARQLLDHLGTSVSRLAATPGVHRQSLRRASHEAWVKHYVRDHHARNHMTDYYGHGALVAFELDLRLRAADPAGDGLDEVLRLLWDRHAGSPEGYTEQDVLDAVAEVGGAALADLVEERVDRPGLPDLDEPIGALGLAWQDQEGPAPTLGIELEESDHEVVVASVERDGPAWRAGISGRDRLLAVAGTTVRRGLLATLLRAYEPGDEVAVTLARGPRLLTRSVRLGAPARTRRLVPAPAPSALARSAFRRWCGTDLDRAGG